MRKHLLLTVLCALVLAMPARSETLIFHASTSGHDTLDEGHGGGNPFASALIETLSKSPLNLVDLASGVRKLTAKKSDGFQNADIPKKLSPPQWSMLPPASGERRLALVMVVADYSKVGLAQSLPGAKHDAERVAASLKRAGFSTEVALDLDLTAMKRRLAAFAEQSAQHDAAVIYTTGHGMEVSGTVYLLPGNYPIQQRTAGLAANALRLSDISASMHAKQVNMLFYAGCRGNPWAN